MTNGRNFLTSCMVLTALSLSLLMVVSCKNTHKTQSSNQSSVSNAHNSRNALDWAGVYSATLPCADCGGINAVITLNADGTYKRQYQYQGKSDSIYEQTGQIVWDKSGSVISLTGEDQSEYYKVVENGLQQLDATGQAIKGPTARVFRFKKLEQHKIVEKYWKLTQLGGQDIHFSGSKEPYMILKMADSSVKGFAGCNRFSGHVRLMDGNRIQFSKIISTKMACPDLSLENQLMQVLQKADNYTQHADTLYLNKARMAPLAQFVAVYMH